MPNRRSLFKNKKFFLTPCIVPGRNAMREMIEYAGGSVDRQRRSLKFMQEQEPLSYFIIAVPKDYHLVADVLRSNLGKSYIYKKYLLTIFIIFLVNTSFLVWV